MIEQSHARRYVRTFRLLTALALGAALTCAHAATNIFSDRYDNNNSAANLTETALNPNSVSASTFGLLWSYAVNGAVFSQPLYVQGVTVAGQNSPLNVLYVTTMQDMVYAFNADSPGAPLWSHNFLSTGITPGTPFDTTTASSGMGIIGTPVIDPSSNRMYFVVETMENGQYVQRLHALDIRSGIDLAATVITATANGQTFNPEYQSQRPGLVLADGEVWLSFASTIPGDFSPWHGWVMTYDKTSLAQTGAFVTTTGNGGGIWQSGEAPAVDSSGNVYFVTGNGAGPTADGVNNFQESLLKFNYNSGLTLKDFYTASNWQNLDNYDLDLSASGALLVPGTNLIAFGGKIGISTVLNSTNLGHLTANNSQVVQSIQTGPVVTEAGNDGDRIIGLAYWNRSNNSLMYAWPGFAALASYTFNGSTFTLNQQLSANLFGEPSAALSVSANGTTVGSGILWAVHNTASGRAIGQAAVLEAYNADNLNSMLWNSNMNGSRDTLPSSGRFVIPVVNNGRVYMATGSGSVQVYGLLSNPPPTTVSPLTVSLASSSSTTLQENPVTLSASVTDPNSGAAVSSVTYYDGSTLIGTSSTAPFSISWSSGTLGTHSLTATAKDNAGATGTSAAISVTVTAIPAGSTVQLGLASVANVWAIAAPGTAPANYGLDGYGDAYASNLLGSTVNWGGSTFTLGSASAADGVSSATIALPAGNYVGLRILGTSVNGASLNQVFTVTYTDGTTSTLTQSLSDWGLPGGYLGESVAASTTYRIAPNGSTSGGTWYVYGYTMALNSAKTVKSLTLPNNRNVVVLAVDLVQATAPAQGTVSVSLSTADNVWALGSSGSATTNGGFDTSGYAFSSQLLGTQLTWAGSTFSLGTASAASAVAATTVTLPAGNYSTLRFLASGAYGPITNQVFTVTYTDGTTSTLTQSISDWGLPGGYTGESVAASTTYRIAPNGSTSGGTWYVYGYTIALNSAKTVKSLTLPNNRNVVVLAVDLVQATAPAQGTVSVSLSTADNVWALGSSGSATTNGGFDTSGYAFSSQLLGTQLTWAGSTFSLGTASAASAVAATTVTLPAGNYSTLRFLASGAYGPITNQVFTVTYTDGTTSTLTQSISDWGLPGGYTGESSAASTTYRIAPNGSTSGGTWYVYGYTIALNSAKTVKSLTLPNNRDVVVLAVDLVP